MNPWHLRPFEIRNLLNPVFCGLVIYRSLEGFELENAQGMPYSQSLLILPLCLHLPTREQFPPRTRSHLLKILEEHSELTVNFAERVAELMPFTQESLAYLHFRSCVLVTEAGRFQIRPKRIRRTLSGSEEMMDIQRVAIKIGREFGKLNSGSTIYTSLGIRP
jgi:hypothetical protein